ncbi:uncharacterized protein LOC106139472 isoform X1 [Amyelois transitella]|uniref:uncharacterized protein LOC106139472 isoform X1 n=1 Tax=Amyelois transitella TaxID=680683 RepID=UPI0029900BCC|nr:uncharacterized protein LOC106139472 isoform X1 [Amyelois transitella]
MRPVGIEINIDNHVFELICANVYLRNKLLFLICVVYIPPKSSDNEYMVLFKIIEQLCDKYTKVIVIGDFNLYSCSANVISYYEFFETYCGFTQNNTVSNCNNRVLDLVLSKFGTCEGVGVCVAGSTLVPVDLQHPPLEILIHHSEGNASDHSRESSPVPNQRVTNIKRPRLEMTEMEPSSVSIKRKSLKYEETVAPKLSLDHSKISSKYDDEDEFDVFGRNVALQLKKLPLIYALESQELIQRVLKEQRIKAIKKKSSKSQYKTYTVVEPSSSDDRDDPLVMKTEYFDESKKNSLRHHCVS